MLAAVGTAVLVIGPRELPIVANKLGYAVGRSVSLLRNARNAAREVSRDPEIAAMTAEVEKGLMDMRRIRDEIQSLSAKAAVPYLLAQHPEPPKEDSSATLQQQPLQPDSQPHQTLPEMPPVGKRLFSPSHTDRIEVAGGADLLIEVMQQSEVARGWKAAKPRD